MLLRRMATKKKFPGPLAYPQYPRDTLVTHKRPLPQGHMKLQRTVIHPKTQIPMTTTIIRKNLPALTKQKPPTKEQIARDTAQLEKYGFAAQHFPEDYPDPSKMGKPLGWKKIRELERLGYHWEDLNISPTALKFQNLQLNYPTLKTIAKRQYAARPRIITPLPRIPRISFGQYVGAIAAAAALAAAQLTWRMGWVAGRERGFGAHGRDVPMKSSVVHYLDYDQTSHTVYVQLTWRRYKYHNVPPSVFSRWWQGLATCITTDRRRKKRWIAGKTPSLGAFYNQHIKGRFAVEKI